MTKDHLPYFQRARLSLCTFYTKMLLGRLPRASCPAWSGPPWVLALFMYVSISLFWKYSCISSLAGTSKAHVVQSGRLKLPGKSVRQPGDWAWPRLTSPRHLPDAGELVSTKPSCQVVPNISFKRASSRLKNLVRL